MNVRILFTWSPAPNGMTSMNAAFENRSQEKLEIEVGKIKARVDLMILLVLASGALDIIHTAN